MLLAMGVTPQTPKRLRKRLRLRLRRASDGRYYGSTVPVT